MDARLTPSAVIAALVVLISSLAITAGPGEARATTKSIPAKLPCQRPLSTTLLETGKVRLYEMPEEPSNHPEHVNPPINGRPVFGCLKGTGKSLLLDLPEVGGEKSASWVKVDPKTVAANGPLVAYAYTQFYFDTHDTWVRVRNLRTGAVTRSCYVGGGRAPHGTPHVIDIALNSYGEVRWRVEGNSPETGESPQPGCNAST